MAPPGLTLAPSAPRHPAPRVARRRAAAARRPPRRAPRAAAGRAGGGGQLRCVARLRHRAIMLHYMCPLLLPALLLLQLPTGTMAVAAAGVSWSGPRLQLQHTEPGGFPALRLSAAGAAGELIPPFWLNLNNQGYANISHVVVQIVRARKAGLRLLAVVLSDALVVPPIAGPTKQIMDLVQEHHPAAKLLVRWYMSRDVLDHPDWVMVLQNISNPAQNTSSVSKNMVHFMNTPAAAWANAAAKNFSAALVSLDAAYPNRIAAVIIEGLETGEWFMPPTSVASMMVGDYTPVMEQEFCAAERSGGRTGACRLPTASARDTPTLGNALMHWSTNSDPAARSFRYNQFISQRVASAITGFAAVVKKVSADRALTMAYSGYLFELSDSGLSGSGHLALSSLLACDDLDMIGSPYQYEFGPREPAGRFTSHGPVVSSIRFATFQAPLFQLWHAGCSRCLVCALFFYTAVTYGCGAISNLVVTGLSNPAWEDVGE
jgi:hypothetical protein